MKRLLPLLVAVSFSVLINSTHAENRILDFAGDWSGKGTYVVAGEIKQCSVMILNFGATGSTFRFGGGERVCEDHSEKFYEVEMTYQNGMVMMGTFPVGTYNDNEMNVAFSAPDPAGGTRHWRMSMRVEGNHLMYEERRTMNDETTPLISFAGILIRQ